MTAMAITIKEVRDFGYNNGYDAVEADIRRLRSMDRDEAAEEAFENEQHSRQYAGFSSFAAELNRLPENRMERLWDAYEEAVIEGIEAALNKHKIGQLGRDWAFRK